MNNIKIFVVHGRDRSALDALHHWFERRHILVEGITFEQLARLGETIPTELERIAVLGDAAVVLATPDDVGKLESDKDTHPRARQNVWLELGWFWARLGRKRTLLLIKGTVEIPSDFSGVLYLKYQSDLHEITRDLEKFVESLHDPEPDSLTEVVNVGSDAHTRSWEYHNVFEEAHELVVITGIGMVNLRQDLPAILYEMKISRTNLKLEIIILDRDIIKLNESVTRVAYRSNLLADIQRFESDLNNLIKANAELMPRVSLIRYNSVMSFAATVADPPNWGSLMLVETILPSDRSHFVARPRMLLRRRCADGLYDRYWSAIDMMRQRGVHVNMNSYLP